MSLTQALSSLCISDPLPSQSQSTLYNYQSTLYNHQSTLYNHQSTLYNHQSTHLPLPLLFLLSVAR